MNKIYKVIWSKVKHCYVVVSEIAKRSGKGSTVSSVTTVGSVAAVLCAIALVGAVPVEAKGTQVAGSNLQGTGSYGYTAIATDAAASYLRPYNYYNPYNMLYSGFNYYGNFDAATRTSSVNNYYSSYNNYDGPTASDGAESVAIGYYSRAHSGSVAVGDYSYANATVVGGENAGFATALGSFSVARGTGSVALGVASMASGNIANALGRQSAAVGNYSQAIGGSSVAAGDASTAIGPSATAIGNQSIAIGGSNVSNYSPTSSARIYNPTGSAQAFGLRSIALGTGSVTGVGSQDAYTGKFSSVVGGTDSVAIGTNAKATKDNATVIGKGSSATGASALALGDTASVTADSAIALGKSAAASGASSAAIGTEAQAQQDNALAFGLKANAVKQGNIAIGTEAYADSNVTNYAQGSTAIGVQAKALGPQSLAVGAVAQATGVQSSAFGNNSTASGYGSIVLGGDDSAAPTGDAYDFWAAPANKKTGISGGSKYRPSASTGIGAIAVGVHAQALSDGSTAIGIASTAGDDVTAIQTAGYVSTAKEATAIGSWARAQKMYSTAIGHGAEALADSATSIGDQATAEGAHSIAIGDTAKARKVNDLVLGANALTHADSLGNNIVMGTSAQVNRGAENVSIGSAAKIDSDQGGILAIGKGASVTSSGRANAVAIGTSSKVEGSGIAIGPSAIVTATSTTNGEGVAIGSNAKVDAQEGGIAIGKGALVTNSSGAGSGPIAIGLNARSTGIKTLAIGTGATADGNQEQVTVIGAGANASGASQFSTLIGAGATATNERSTALGYKANVTVAGGVALGSGSVANRASWATETTSAYIPASATTAQQAAINATKANEAAVSVGSSDGSAPIRRQITNVAAGYADTDAVNVSQLKAATAQAGSWTVSDGKSPEGTKTIDSANNKLVVKGATDLVETTVDNTGLKIGINSTQLDNFISNNTTIQRLREGFAISDASGTVHGIRMDREDPVQVQFTGEAGKIQVSVSGEEGSNGIVHITTDPNLGQNIDISNNSTINSLKAGFDVTVAGNTATKSTIKAGEALNFVAGDNAVVTTTAGSKTVTIGVSKTPVLDSVTAGGATISKNSSGATYLTGLSNTTFDANSIVANRAATEGQLQSVANGVNDVVGRLLNTVTDYSLVANPATGSDGKYKVTNNQVALTVKDGLHPNAAARTVVIDDVASAAALQATNTTVQQQQTDITNLKTGLDTVKLNVTGDNATSASVNLKDQKLAVTGANGVKTTASGQGITVGLTQSPLTVGTNGQVTTANTGDAYATAKSTADAINAANTKLTETLTTGLTDKGLKFSANSGGEVTNKLGSKVTVQGAGTGLDSNYSGSNIKTKVTQDTATGNTTIDVMLAKAITVDSVRAGGATLGKDSSGATYLTGLGNTTYDSNNIVANRAATEGQLSGLQNAVTNQITNFINNASDYSLVANPAQGSNGKYTVQNGQVALTVADQMGSAPAQTVVIEGIASASDLQKLRDAAVTYDKNTDGSVNKDKITLGGTSGTTITNLKDGNIASGSKDAVTGGQLYTVQEAAKATNTTVQQHTTDITNLKAGFDVTVAGNTATKSTIKAGEALNFVAGDNAVVTTTKDSKTVTVGMSKTPVLDKVTITNTATTPGAGNVVIDGNGINAGSKVISNVASGGTTETNAANIKDVKDAVKTATETLTTGLTDKGLKFSANSGGEVTNKLGSKVTVQGSGTEADANYSGSNIKTKVSQDTATGNTTIDVMLAKAITVDSVKAGAATLGKDATGGTTLTGLSNTTWNPANPTAVSGRAATEDQLKTLNDAVQTNITGASQ